MSRRGPGTKKKLCKVRNILSTMGFEVLQQRAAYGIVKITNGSCRRKLAQVDAENMKDDALAVRSCRMFHERRQSA